MLRLAAALGVGLVFLPATAMAQQRAELMVGWLSYSDGMITQQVSIRNNAIDRIRIAAIGCSFAYHEKRFAAGSVKIENIDPDASGYASISIRSAKSPDRATCQLQSVTWRHDFDGTSALAHDVIRRSQAIQAGPIIRQPIDPYR